MLCSATAAVEKSAAPASLVEGFALGVVAGRLEDRGQAPFPALLCAEHYGTLRRLASVAIDKMPMPQEVRAALVIGHRAPASES